MCYTEHHTKPAREADALISDHMSRIPNPSISLLGSTGSIGRQTLEVAGALGLRVRALAANTNTRLLEEQARRFKPGVVAVYDEASARDFRMRTRDMDFSVVAGMDGLIEAATVDGAGTVVTAIVGTVGLRPTLSAIELGRRVALANKETLVCAGEYMMKCAREHGAEIIPVDSEHSALFQCLRGGARRDVKKLILTASGGPFRGMTRNELLTVTPDMALRHPNWSMGRKITVDSATLMNKGLEMIEAVHLFGVPPDDIDIVVHPESIVHSMVEFADNSIVAQLALPDMRLPIQYALTYPARLPSMAGSLDIVRQATLIFEAADTDTFPCLGLAIQTAGIRGTACAVLNGANEAAVELFLRGGLSFYGIYDSVSAALDNIGNVENPSFDDITAADEAAKAFVFERIKG